MPAEGKPLGAGFDGEADVCFGGPPDIFIRGKNCPCGNVPHRNEYLGPIDDVTAFDTPGGAGYASLVQEFDFFDIRSGPRLRGGQRQQTGFSRLLAVNHLPQNPFGDSGVARCDKAGHSQVMHTDDVCNTGTGRGNLFQEKGTRRHIVSLSTENFRNPHGIEAPPVCLVNQIPGEEIRVFMRATIQFQGEWPCHFFIEFAGNGNGLSGFLYHVPGHAGAIGQTDTGILKFWETRQHGCDF